MTTMARKIYRFAILAGVLLATWLSLCKAEMTNNPDKSVCEHWTDIAKKMTGEGKAQTCVNNKTSSCTRIDCSGTYQQERLSEIVGKSMDLDYCFGTRLNSCLKPISVDFYLEVPDKNVTVTRRIRHSTEIDITALQMPAGPLGTIHPALNFEFEKQSDGNIAFSVNLKAKTESGLELHLSNLIDEETVHATSCANLTEDSFTNDKGVDNENIPGLIVTQCHPEKYSTPAPPKHDGYKPSETLGKSCDISTKLCGVREMCDIALDSPVCICETEWTKSAKGDACLSPSLYGKKCYQHEDCSYWEECDSSKKVCVCQDSYTYSDVHQMCVSEGSGNPSGQESTAKPASGTTSAKSDTTPQPKGNVNGTDTDSGSTGNNIMTKLPAILGGVLGGMAIVCLLVWGFIVLKKRRLLRSRLSTALEARDGATEALLGDTDDMIM